MLPDRSPESALPYEADPVCEVVPARAFWICRILKTSLGRGWLWTVTVSSSSCPVSVRMVALVKCLAKLGLKYIRSENHFGTIAKRSTTKTIFLLKHLMEKGLQYVFFFFST